MAHTTHHAEPPKRVGMHRIHGTEMYLGHYGKRTDPTRTREARRVSKARRQATTHKEF